MASAASSQPVLRKVDISTMQTVLQVATTLRRLWLVDPSSPVLQEQLAKLREEGAFDHDHEHDHSNCEGHDHGDPEHAHEADLEHKHDDAHGKGKHKEEEEEADSDDESSCGCGHSHGDDSDEEDSELYQIFPLALQSIAGKISENAAPDADDYNDKKWKASTDLVLIDPPVGPTTSSPSDEKTDEKEGDEEESDDDSDAAISSPLFTPFRQQVYGIYNHVFNDAWDALRAQLTASSSPEEKVEQIGEFEPPSTTIMVLEAPDDDDESKEGIEHEFETDTFVYPVWVGEGCKLAISLTNAEGELLGEIGEDGQKWTEVWWFKAGTKIVVRPLPAATEGEGKKLEGEVAVLALGVCEPVGGEKEGEEN